MSFPFSKLLYGVSRELLQVLAPSECPGCGALGRPLCDRCASVPRVARDEILHGIRVLSASSYEGPLSLAIRAFKYQERTELASPLARWLWPLLDCLDEKAVLTPVPMHAERLAERGYNQAALLAGALGRGCGRSVDYRLLERVRQTKQQAGLGAQERRVNVEGSFAVRKARSGERCFGWLGSQPSTSVILIDDVVTTGSTFGGCVRVLHQAGYRVVACLALARALH
ncbi:MAG: ComF family protein [Polyangiaceae bacterium]|nr:ComF family protein [Polyangiaceae bacterium]